MRVVHLIKVKGVAGAENHLLLLLAGLRGQGIDAHLHYLVNPSQPVPEFMDAAKALDIPVTRGVIRSHFSPGIVRQLARELAPLKPDIVHTHLLHADLYGALAGRFMRVNGRRPRVLSSRHNDDQFRYRAPIRLLNRALWRIIDHGIAISEAVRRFSIDTEGARPERIRTILYGYQPNVGDPEAARREARASLGLPADAIVVGAVCRLIEQKGLRYGLEAFARASTDFPAARLLIVGDGPLRHALEGQAKSLGLGERIAFLGWRADAAALMPAFDIFLMPSLWEGFGLVLLEAMAASVPVVGSRVSAIPEVVLEGETGLLAPPRDVDALAGHLRGLLGDAPLRRHMGMMGRERLETQFSMGGMVAATAALYREALA
ncbi:MAG: glycosyltransferase [Pleurocapsa minor GSE-CHR-MK-17-07R]|jgi:glycosyltransferase involved in cell wall biosynthesis|nr:glycosyltransferase [Pleurocapsa minor GSE-CHR-MK 17-07R]